MEFENNSKNPNDLHDYLINNGCKPIALRHDAEYDFEQKVVEAKKIWVEIEPENEQKVINLVNQFMSQ